MCASLDGSNVRTYDGRLEFGPREVFAGPVDLAANSELAARNSKNSGEKTLRAGADGLTSTG